MFVLAITDWNTREISLVQLIFEENSMHKAGRIIVDGISRDFEGIEAGTMSAQANQLLEKLPEICLIKDQHTYTYESDMDELLDVIKVAFTNGSQAGVSNPDNLEADEGSSNTRTASGYSNNWLIVMNQERIDIESEKSKRSWNVPAGIDDRIGFPLARAVLDINTEAAEKQHNVTMLIFLSQNKVVEVTYLDEFSRLETRKFDGTQFSAIREWASHNMLIAYLRANWEIRETELNPLQALINMHIPSRAGNQRSEFTAQDLHEALGVPAKDIDGIGLRVGDLWNINVDGKFWMYWKHSLSINNS